MSKLISFVTILLFMCPHTFAQDTFKNQFILQGGLQYVNYSDFSLLYPEIGLEYKVTNASAFEFQVAHFKWNEEWFHSYRTLQLSAGYKLNVIPIFTSNPEITSRIGIYAAARYVLRNHYSREFDVSNLVHDITFAPGVDLFLTKKFGLNFERSFWIGSSFNNRSTFRIKYKL